MFHNPKNVGKKMKLKEEDLNQRIGKIMNPCSSFSLLVTIRKELLKSRIFLVTKRVKYVRARDSKRDDYVRPC